MTVKELLDVFDVNREYDSQFLEIVKDDWDEIDILSTDSPLLQYIENQEITCMSAENPHSIRVQLKGVGR